jgi:hypothetical protein
VKSIRIYNYLIFKLRFNLLKKDLILKPHHQSRQIVNIRELLSTLRLHMLRARGSLRVDPERRFPTLLKTRGLVPPNGSNFRKKSFPQNTSKDRRGEHLYEPNCFERR